MPLRVKCPAGHKLIVPDDRAGRTLRCPRCGADVVVPEGEARVQGSGFGVQGSEETDGRQETGDKGQRTEDRKKQHRKTVDREQNEVAVFTAERAEAAGSENEEDSHAAESAGTTEQPPGPFDFVVVDEPPRAPPVLAREKASAQLHADAGRTLAVYQLAAALVAAAVLSVVPAVWDVVQFVQSAEIDAPPVARWALVLFFLAVVQMAYAVYLFQLPDWSSVWVVTVLLLTQAAGYAGVLGIVLTSDTSGLLVGAQGLQLADKLADGKAALWCLCMVSVATILAFFAGRMSLTWQRAERVLRLAGY
jgi:hypothetical protein